MRKKTAFLSGTPNFFCPFLFWSGFSTENFVSWSKIQIPNSKLICFFLLKISLVQSNLTIGNSSELFFNAKCSLILWSKLAIGHGKWFLNKNKIFIRICRSEVVGQSQYVISAEPRRITFGKKGFLLNRFFAIWYLFWEYFYFEKIIYYYKR